MQLNEYECSMLDGILAAFDSQGSLSVLRLAHVLEDEKVRVHWALCVLEAYGLVTVSGHMLPNGLPHTLRQTPAAITFMANGGFSAPKESIAPYSQAQHIASLEKKIAKIDRAASIMRLILIAAAIVITSLLILYCYFYH